MSGYTPFYGPVYGSFPDVPLDVAVDLDVAGWTEITSYVLQREGTSPPISITCGRPDEKSTASPSSCTMQWNNRDGRFSRANPTGPYYGLLNRNTPLRLSVPGSGTYLRFADDTTSCIATPDSAGLGLSGDAEWQLDLDLDSWMPCVLVSKDDADTQRSWSVRLNGDGTVSLYWYETITHSAKLAISTLPLPLGRVSLRITLAMSSGTVTWYTSTTPIDASPSWTQLGSQVLAGSTSMTTATSSVAVGYNAAVTALDAAGGFTVTGPAGKIYGFALLSGIGGTPVASPDFTTATTGASSLTDAQGNVWTLAGTAEFSGRCYLFHGECSSLPQRWDTTGTDVWAPVTASGLLRRLQAGNAPVYSAMRRGIVSYPSGPSSQPAGAAGPQSTIAYWSCEDPQGATSFASSIAQNSDGLVPQPAQFTGTPGIQGTAGSPSADSVFACSAQLPQIQQSQWVFTVPPYNGNSSAFGIPFLLAFGASGPGVSGNLLTATFAAGGFAFSLTVAYSTASSGSVTLTGPGGTTAAITGVNGQAYWAQLSNVGTGTATAQFLLLTPSGAQTAVTVASDAGNLTAFTVNPGQLNLGDTEAGHFWVSGGFSGAPVLGALGNLLNAWDGETAAARVARLCGENGVATRVYGYPDTSAVMQAQQIDTLASILASCETSDRGILYEPAEALGLGYRTLSSLCSQAPGAVFDYTAAELGGDGGDGLEPEDDDQYTVNDATVSRNNGGSVQVQVTDGPMSVQPPPDGVGDYATAVTAYTAADSGLADIAGWVTHVGTCDEERYPVIPVNLARSAVAGLVYGIQDMRLGGYTQISNLPGWTAPGPAKQLVYGKTTGLGGFFYQVAWNAVPESPYETVVLDDPVYGRLDTDGSTLAAAASSSATSLSVATTNPGSPLWTTSGGDVPFDIAIGGEQITVTAVSAGTMTVTAAAVPGSANGILLRIFVLTHAALAAFPATAAQSGAAAHQASITTTVTGSVVYGAIVDGTAATVPPDAGCTMIDNVVDTPNGQCYATFSAGPTGTPGAATVGTVASFSGGMAALEVLASGGSVTVDGSSPAVADSTLASVVTTAAFTPPAGALIVALVDATAAAAGVTTMGLSGGGVVWTERVKAGASGNGYAGIWTAVAPAASSPQAFTVTRSVNGVVKAQAAGADVRLFHPPIWALA